MKLVQIEDYLLLIDEKTEIKEGDYRIMIDKKSILYGKFEKHIANHECNKQWCKTIAYRKLNEEAKELDLLLLTPFGDYSMGRAKEFAIDRFQDTFEKFPRGGKLTNDALRDVIGVSVETGYEFAIKESQSKISFSLEDIKKAIEMAREDYYIRGYQVLLYSTAEIIDALYAQQLPKEFILGEGGTIEEQIKNGYYIW